MLHTLRQISRGVRGLAFARPGSNETIALQLERHAGRQPDVPFLLFEERRYSYAEANAAVNRYAEAYRSLGVGHGDVVALVLENRPEYLFHIYGLHKLGAVASLINNQLTGDVLVHALRICEPSHAVIGSEVWSSFEEVRGELPAIAGHVHVDQDEARPCEADAPDFGALASAMSSDNPAETAQHKLGDLAAYIYTSGTTGMPKAAIIKHLRLFRAGAVWASLGLRYRKGDVLYNCLPLYHSNAIMLATGSVITAGATMALARRFSRSRFWSDVRRYDASSFIYIGELCRYLMNSEPSDQDRDHKIRIVTGNGLRPDIWPKFQQRFGIKRVSEFYGATEGNCITINFRNVVGSVGPALPGMVLARWDEETQDFVRRDDGRLVKAPPGEPGILLGKIEGASKAFDGYRDAAATEGKVIRNAFGQGDAYFNTGDLLRMDRQRNLYFTDRVGDTFRWKGENVSTTEVQEQISKWPPAAEVNVYGVQVEGTDGRAGMASMVIGNGGFDPSAFRQHVEAALPSYARPLFVRLTKAIQTTGTFKMKKNDLQADGFDPNKTSDPIYVLHPEEGEYTELTEQLYQDVINGKLRL
ncbi:MAG: long-chain-acyl-CoA synthetase [Myxococcales bacterium]|nr:long-chain-acyl-CoA synthetase [Myxococcales bacterium]